MAVLRSNSAQTPEPDRNEFLSELVLPQSPKIGKDAAEALNTIGVLLAGEEQPLRGRIFSALSSYLEELVEIRSFADNAAKLLKSGNATRDDLDKVDRHFVEVPARLKEMWSEVNHGTRGLARDLQDEIVLAMNDPIREALGDAYELIDLFQVVDANVPSSAKSSLTSEERADIVRAALTRIGAAYGEGGLAAAYREAVHPSNLEGTDFKFRASRQSVPSDADPLDLRRELAEYVQLDIGKGIVPLPVIMVTSRSGPSPLTDLSKRDVLVLVTEQLVRLEAAFGAKNVTGPEIIGAMQTEGLGDLLDDFHRARLRR